MRGVRRAGLVAGLALVASACVGGGSEPIPDVLDRYLRLLQDGDVGTAYELTNLDRIAPQRGAALSLEHFEAFYRSNPLEGYQVAKVYRLERRTVEAFEETGSPSFVIDLDLLYEPGPSRETYYVEGEVLPKVEIEPDQLVIRAPADASYRIDGVAVDPLPSADGDLSFIVLLRGRHQVEIEGAVFTVDTAPLTIVDGPARVVETDGGRPVIELAR